ncbi:MAG: polymer-forming cytoskeletal protein [Gammaproteobacteria bacterium]|nr:polymer-forming cytoskeletal protein [Gammaproteobacteria bacterium]
MDQLQRIVLLIALFAGWALPVNAANVEYKKHLVVTNPVIDDLYLAGQTVEVATKIQGDLVVAGHTVSMSKHISGDIIAAGETVTLRGFVGDDARLAGRNVTLAARTTGHLVAAGDHVILATEATTGSSAWLAGRIIKVLGHVGGELKAAGQEVIISGTVEGDVDLTAKAIHILDSARIHGRLRYRSENSLDIAENAQIMGEVERLEMPEVDMPDKHTGIMVGLIFASILILGLFITGALYLLAFPVFSAKAAELARQKVWASVGLGFTLFVCVPVVAVIFMATVIGLLPAVVLFIIYALILLFGYIAGLHWLCELIANRKPSAQPGSRVRLLVTFFLVLLATSFIRLIPLIGWLIGLFIWLIGIGSLVLSLFGRYRRQAPYPNLGA